MDVMVIGVAFFLAVLTLSLGTEVYERYQTRRDGDDAPEGSFVLLPRRRYSEMHRELYAPASTAPTAAPGTFLVKREQVASRCEVCHQSDQFSLETGYCARCKHVTG